MNISQQIKNSRKKAKMSQEKLAKKAKISRQYVSDLERGVSKPSLEMARKLAKVLEFDL